MENPWGTLLNAVVGAHVDRPQEGHLSLSKLCRMVERRESGKVVVTVPDALGNSM
jgi:hypothetical protein